MKRKYYTQKHRERLPIDHRKEYATPETNCFAGGIELKKEPYRRVPFGEEWKVNLAEELLATKAGDLEVTNISNNNLDSILEDVCCC